MISLVALGSYFYFTHKPQNQAFSALRCPDEYQSKEDRIKAFDMFVSAFFEINPGATYADLVQARYDFYVEFNCVEALKRESDYQNGNLDPETQASIERVLRGNMSQ